MKIGIIGMGWVGSSVAISILHQGVAKELLLWDQRQEVAEGEALDLAQGAAFYPPCRVRVLEPAQMRDADAVVITAGIGGKGGQTRLQLLGANAQVMTSICQELRGAKGLLVVVSNPVDVLTRVAVQASGLPPHRVLGTGTMLDTARLRQLLGLELDLDPRSIHAQVLGEHGDSSVISFSGAQIGGVPLRSWEGWDPMLEPKLTGEVRRAAYEIIRRKGATNHAIGLVTAALLRWAFGRTRRVLTVSRVQDGALGYKGVALSLPTLVGPLGATDVVPPPLDPSEREALDTSARILEEAYQEISKGSSEPSD